MVTSLVPRARCEVVRHPLGETAIRLLEFSEHLWHIEVLHVDVCVLERVVEAAKVGGQADVVGRDLEDLIGEVLQ